jgi:hypothetical protein
MKIMRFDESSKPKPNYDSFFTLKDEEIEDLAVNFTDDGWKISIRKSWISEGTRTDQPTSVKSVPRYTITLTKPDRLCINSPERWDGSYYLDTKGTLRQFATFVSRLESYGSTYYHITNTRYVCEVHLPEVDTEIGFDWGQFQKELLKIVDKYESLWVDFDKTEHTSSHNHITLEFKKLHDLVEIQKNITEDSNNKNEYLELKSDMEECLKQYSDYVDYRISFVDSRWWKIKKKVGFMKVKEYEFTFYNIRIDIRRK